MLFRIFGPSLSTLFADPNHSFTIIVLLCAPDAAKTRIAIPGVARRQELPAAREQGLRCHEEHADETGRGDYRGCAAPRVRLPDRTSASPCWMLSHPDCRNYSLRVVTEVSPSVSGVPGDLEILQSST